MQQDRILVIDLGGTDNTKVARDIRSLGVYSEIHPHDLNKEDISRIPGIKGIILNGGPNRIVDGKEIDASSDIYNFGVPILSVDHKGSEKLPRDEKERKSKLNKFLFDECKAGKNWNIEDFIKEQVEEIKKQVGDKKVLLALSGGVDC